MVRNHPQSSLSTLLEIAQLHFQDKNHGEALAAHGEMEEVMRRLVRQDDAPEFFRAMTFRSYWAPFMARLWHPDPAWQLARHAAPMTTRQPARLAEPVPRPPLVLPDRMRPPRYAHGRRPAR